MKPAYIPRPMYFDKVKPFIGKSLIKVFTGQRRVGKSFLMYQVMNEMDDDVNIIYIDKEDYAFDSIKDYRNLIEYIESNRRGTKNAIFIDEIQDIEDFEKALRSLYKQPDMDIYITGSNAKMLSGELATYLSGRYIEVQVHSLSYKEYLTFNKIDDPDAISFNNYLKYGGLPNLIHLDFEDNVLFDYLRNISETIIYRDIIRRNNIRNVAFLEKLMRYLADNLGSLVSAKKIADFLKSQRVSISPNSVLDYLKYLNDSFVAQKVQRQDIEGKKIFEIGEKYYFEDLGIRNALVGYRINDIQKLLENVVYKHLKICGYEVRTGVDGNKEIDFIAIKNNEKIYIQVCYLLESEKTMEREFGNLLKVQDQYPKYVLSMSDFESKNTYQGIIHKRISDFLLSFE